MVGTGVCFLNESDAMTFCSSERYREFAIMGVLSDYCKNNYKKVYAQIHENLDSYDSYDCEAAKAAEEADDIINGLSTAQLKALKLALSR